MHNLKTRATIEFPKQLWREFMVYVKQQDTTASKLIRNFVSSTLEKAKEEQN